MTTFKYLEQSEKRLTGTGIATARLDCLVLLEDSTGRDRAWLLAHPEFVLQGPTLKKLERQIERRAKHEPLAYIRGKSEFYGREFKVSKDTLEPRPETETMIELLKLLPLHEDGPRACILDVGTGSGCLAITAKMEFPEVEVLATDISPACLKIAKHNAKNLSANVKFYQGNLLEPLPSTVYRLPSTLLCNLPYVPDSHTINQAAMFEPKVAIFGGPDGLDLYRELFRQIAKNSQKPDYILTESLPFQHKKLTAIAKTANYRLLLADDFIQIYTRS